MILLFVLKLQKVVLAETILWRIVLCVTGVHLLKEQESFLFSHFQSANYSVRV